MRFLNDPTLQPIKMNELQHLFQGITNSTEVDDVLSRIDVMLPLENDSLSFLLIRKLNALLVDENININAKSRRRIKRILQRYEDILPNMPEQDSAMPIVENESLKKEISKPLDAKSAALILQNAQSINKVEDSLNRLCNPDINARCCLEWQNLKKVLCKVLANRNATNKTLRRRITRLIFVLSSDEERNSLAAIKMDAKSASVIPLNIGVANQKRKYETYKEPVYSDISSKTAVMQHLKSFEICYKELLSATSPLELDNAISNVSVNSVGDEAIKDVVRKTLEQAMSNDHLVNNTKIKRKVMRLISTLKCTNVLAEDKNATKIDCVVAAGENDCTDIPKIKKSRTENNTFDATSSVVALTSNDNANTSDFNCTDSNAVNCIDNEGSHISSSGSPISIPAIVNLLKSVKSADELDTVLVQLDLRTVLPLLEDYKNEANCNSEPQQQLLLLRIGIDTALNRDSVSSSMNAKVRRRVNRITNALSDVVVPDYSCNSTVDRGHSMENKTNTNVDIMSAKVKAIPIKQQPQQSVPYVVFVGNLPYDVTVKELEDHFSVAISSSHVDDASASSSASRLKIRLRTDAVSGQGIGIAFVELSNARDMHQCIAMLHHSTLRGRVINIEKSCGGRNKQLRGERINNKRSEQQRKAEDCVDRVLQQYEQKGVLHQVHKWGETIKAKFYGCGASLVDEVN